jgi:hypothetical protein
LRHQIFERKKRKELEEKTNKKATTKKESKVGVKITWKIIVKKRNILVESSLSSHNEVSLPPSKEAFYTMLEATPKNDWSNLFTSRKPNNRFLTQQCPSQICFTFFHPFAYNSLCTLQVT